MYEYSSCLVFTSLVCGCLFIKFDATSLKSWFYVLCLAFNILDDVLQPTVPLQSQRAPSTNQQSGKILANDLDSSLANLVGSKCEALRFIFPLFTETIQPKAPLYYKKTNKQTKNLGVYISVFPTLTDLGFGGTPSKK